MERNVLVENPSLITVMGLGGAWGKATKNRWTELLLVEGNEMNRAYSTRLEDDGGMGLGGIGAVCRHMGYHRAQTPH